MNIFSISRKSKGFTLIELLVVISIIALLSSVVLASLNTAREKARYTAIVQELKQTEIALWQYYTDKGCFPRHDSTSCGGYVAGSANTVANMIANTDLKKYISSAPVWPFSSQSWRYDNNGDERPATCTTYSTQGIKIYVYATVEQYRILNTMLDGDANPDTSFAMGCGKILFTGGSNPAIGYLVSPTQ